MRLPQQLQLEGGKILAFVNHDMLQRPDLQSVHRPADQRQRRQILLPDPVIRQPSAGFLRQLRVSVLPQEALVQLLLLQRRELLPVLFQEGLRPGVDFPVPLIPHRVELLHPALPLRPLRHPAQDRVRLPLRQGGILFLQHLRRGLHPLPDDLLQLPDPGFQRRILQLPQENVLQLLPGHQGNAGHPESVFGKNLFLQRLQPRCQPPHESQGSPDPQQPADPFPFPALQVQVLFQPALPRNLRHPFSHAFRAPALKGSLDHPLHPQVRKHLGYVGEEQGVRRQNHHVLRLQALLERVQEIGDPVQGNGGLSASRRPLHQQIPVQPVADHDVLLRLNRGDDILQPVRGDAAQHLLQVGLLGNDSRVKNAQQLPAPDVHHPFQRQLAPDLPVRGGVVHGADLAGVVKVRRRGPPVHHHRVQGSRIQHAPAPQVVGFRGCSGRGEIQPGKVCLLPGHGQLVQPVQLRPEQLHGHLFLLIRILLHLHVHAFPGLCPGHGFHLGDLPPDGVAGLLQVQVFLPCVRMLRKSGLFHSFFLSAACTKKASAVFFRSRRGLQFCSCKRVEGDHTEPAAFCQGKDFPPQIRTVTGSPL